MRTETPQFIATKQWLRHDGAWDSRTLEAVFGMGFTPAAEPVA